MKVQIGAYECEVKEVKSFPQNFFLVEITCNGKAEGTRIIYDSYGDSEEEIAYHAAQEAMYQIFYEDEDIIAEMMRQDAETEAYYASL